MFNPNKINNQMIKNHNKKIRDIQLLNSASFSCNPSKLKARTNVEPVG